MSQCANQHFENKKPKIPVDANSFSSAAVGGVYPPSGLGYTKSPLRDPPTTPLSPFLFLSSPGPQCYTTSDAASSPLPQNPNTLRLNRDEGEKEKKRRCQIIDPSPSLADCKKQSHLPFPSSTKLFGACYSHPIPSHPIPSHPIPSHPNPIPSQSHPNPAQPSTALSSTAQHSTAQEKDKEKGKKRPRSASAFPLGPLVTLHYITLHTPPRTSYVTLRYATHARQSVYLL